MDRLRPVDRTGGLRGTVPVQDVEVQREETPIQIAAGCGDRPSMDAEKYFIVTEIDWRVTQRHGIQEGYGRCGQRQI